MTLRMDDGLIAVAKAEAAQRGKSVSQMVGEFISLLGQVEAPVHELPPVTASLRSVLKRKSEGGRGVRRWIPRSSFLYSNGVNGS